MEKEKTTASEVEVPEVQPVQVDLGSQISDIMELTSGSRLVWNPHRFLEPLFVPVIYLRF